MLEFCWRIAFIIDWSNLLFRVTGFKFYNLTKLMPACVCLSPVLFALESICVWLSGAGSSKYLRRFLADLEVAFVLVWLFLGDVLTWSGSLFWSYPLTVSADFYLLLWRMLEVWVKIVEWRLAMILNLTVVIAIAN